MEFDAKDSASGCQTKRFAKIGVGGVWLVLHSGLGIGIDSSHRIGGKGKNWLV